MVPNRVGAGLVPCSFAEVQSNGFNHSILDRFLLVYFQPKAKSKDEASRRTATDSQSTVSFRCMAGTRSVQATKIYCCEKPNIAITEAGGRMSGLDEIFEEAGNERLGSYITSISASGAAALEGV